MLDSKSFGFGSISEFRFLANGGLAFSHLLLDPGHRCASVRYMLVPIPCSLSSLLSSGEIPGAKSATLHPSRTLPALCNNGLKCSAFAISGSSLQLIMSLFFVYPAGGAIPKHVLPNFPKLHYRIKH